MTLLQKPRLVMTKDKNSLLIGLNIRITELHVKQKGDIKTESLEIGDDLDSRRLQCFSNID
jgi:hypothetical protein